MSACRHNGGHPAAASRCCESVTLSRKDFLRGAVALASLPLLRPLLAHADTPLETVEIAPGVFVHQGRYEMQSRENRGDMANASFVVGRDCVAVIDTSSSAVVGRDLKAAIRSVTRKPIRYVINTHMHPDHVFGNAVFKEDKPDFVANHKMAPALTARADRYLTVMRQMMGPEASQGIEIVLPTMNIEQPTSIDLGGRQLRCEIQRTAHTDNDMVITDSATDTLFLGDLLFSVYCPTLDGSILGWLAVIDDFEKRQCARVVPGHGPHVMHLPDALKPEQRYLGTIVSDIRKLLKENKPIEDAIKTAGFSERDAWKLFDEYHVRNVTAAYAELEWS